MEEKSVFKTHIRDIPIDLEKPDKNSASVQTGGIKGKSSTWTQRQVPRHERESDISVVFQEMDKTSAERGASGNSQGAGRQVAKHATTVVAAVKLKKKKKKKIRNTNKVEFKDPSTEIPLECPWPLPSFDPGKLWGYQEQEYVLPVKRRKQTDTVVEQQGFVVNGCPGSFVQTDSQYGNALMPVFPRIPPPPVKKE